MNDLSGKKIAFRYKNGSKASKVSKKFDLIWDDDCSLRFDQ